MSFLFDGREYAREREQRIASFIRKNSLRFRMASVVFKEDAGSLLYTRLKHQAAVRVGIEFSVEEISITEPLEGVVRHIHKYVEQPDIHGVMIQKPMKDTWAHFHNHLDDKFKQWWQELVSNLDPDQDVDCLTRFNLDRVYSGQWRILPATVKAVVSILSFAHQKKLLCAHSPHFDLSGCSIVVIGRSEIVGKPLASVLSQYHGNVQLFGSNLDENALSQADVVVSATGIPGLVKEHMVKPGAVVIDVGAPRGDVDELVRNKASFFTPVPGGVGPVTVLSLLENLVELVVNNE